MAPELLNPSDSEEPLSTKESDVYAFAGVSYQVCTSLRIYTILLTVIHQGIHWSCTVL